jgi:hypothetical protein
MATSYPYMVTDRVTVKEGRGHCEDQLKYKFGATSKFINYCGKYFQVYTYDGRFFIIDQQFSKRKGQMFDTYLCEVTLIDGIKY